MTGLDKIVYLADKIEPTRDYPGVDVLRSLAQEDIWTTRCLPAWTAYMHIWCEKANALSRKEKRQGWRFKRNVRNETGKRPDNRMHTANKEKMEVTN